MEDKKEICDDDKEQIFYDEITCKYFVSTVNKIKMATNTASNINDFYKKLEIE